MKKFAGIMVATVLAFSLVACGPVDSAVQNLAGAASNKGSDVVTADDDGYAEGRIGDVMRTYFFDYTVNSCLLYTSHRSLWDCSRAVYS